MQYQGSMHRLQRELMGGYFQELTDSAEGRSQPAVHMLVSGNPVELVRAFGLVPVFPEVNALQLAVKKQALPYILKAEEMGYSVDNCAYVKADIGLLFSDLRTPFARIPPPSLLLCNYVGCNVYLQWFEHLAEYTKAPVFNLDIPFLRDWSARPLPEDVSYVVSQLEDLIEVMEPIAGKSLDYKELQRVMDRSAETGELWAEIKSMNKNIPVPFDGYFDAVTMMGPLYCLRGTEEGVTFFRETHREMAERVKKGIGVVPEERFRFVCEGPPPWPHLRSFRDMFARWGAVCVMSTYSTVGGLWEWGFKHDSARPLESLAEHMICYNLTIRTLFHRYEQIKSYVEEWDADGLVIHSVKSCRLFSAGQGDMRHYFVSELGVPTLLVESDLQDPRYFSEAQMRNRIDAFFESLENQKLLKK